MDRFPYLEINIFFFLAVPIIWVLFFICWIEQTAAFYKHLQTHDEKKNDDELTTEELSTYKLGLEDDLKEIRSAEEITRLKEEIEHLKTRVEIESIRAEIYNLKMLAAKGN